MTGRTILITGVSGGFGEALATEALAQGWRVVGTVRTSQALQTFEAKSPGNAIGRILDMMEIDRIPGMIAEIEEQVGPIDVLVNNAGYGLEAPLEELRLESIRHQFEVNVFAPIVLMQAVLPYMRKRRGGRILNISSIGGMMTFPGLGAYHASKFALEAISESLGKEVRHFGIFVTAVEPGPFRTDWAGRSLVREPRTIADYDSMFDPQREIRRNRDGKQPGDPVKAAKAMLTILAEPNPPAHLLLGPEAVQRIDDRLKALAEEIDAWRALSVSTDFD